MPLEGEGVFDGDGSVRWEVRTVDDDDIKVDVKTGKKHKVVEEVRGKGRRNAGADRKHADDFTLVLKAPSAEPAKGAFLAQFSDRVKGDVVRLKLPVAKIRNQIRVQWGFASRGEPGDEL